MTSHIHTPRPARSSGHPARRALRLLLVTIGLALALGSVGALGPSANGARAADKSFDLDSWNTTAILETDGDMRVTEQLTYNFRGGPFTIGTRTFAGEWYSRITDFTVDLNGQPLQVDEAPDTPSGGFEWHLPEPTSDAQVTYTLRYVVQGAADVGPDVAELYWQFTGTDHPYIGQMYVEVQLPGSSPNATPETPPDDASVIRAWGHGPRNGTVTLGEQTVDAAVDGVQGGQFVELRILLPAADMTAATPSGEPRLAGVIAEEGEFIGELGDKPKEPDPWYRPIGFVGAPVIAAGGLGALAALWRKWGREPTSREVLGDYWREPLTDPPAVVVATRGRGAIDRSKAIAGTLMDMAQRGYIRVVADERGKEHTFQWAGREYGPDVQPFERRLLDIVFRGQTEMSEDDLTRWARRNRTTAAGEMNGWVSQVSAAYQAKGYSTSAKGKPLGVLLAVAAGMVLLGLLMLALSGPIGVIALVAAVLVVLIGLKVLGNRTQPGAEANAKAEGLARFLKDFSQLDEAPVGHLVLWERYLVDAVALGVSKDLVRNLAFKVPEVANDPAFAVWYVGGYGPGRFESMGRVGDIGSNIASSFQPPSSSGSGGGFSGGGGGGGGGGGAGAR